MKIAVTGARGLLGWHSAARIHAANCAASYKGESEPFELVQIGREEFADEDVLAGMLSGVDAVLHFAGVNRGTQDEVETGNPAIATRLVAACERAQCSPDVVYANTVHAAKDTPYGRSKRDAGEILRQAFPRYTDVVLPHIYGEGARPNYNNVTATLIEALWSGTRPTIDPQGRVQLLHAGAAADLFIEAAKAGTTGQLSPPGKDISVQDLFDKLEAFHRLYTGNVFPKLEDRFDLTLFNCLRSAAYPGHYPMRLQVNSDHRGRLFETAKGGGESQTFVSITPPGKIRGEHFHFDLVERFVVLSGDAVIRIRKVLTDETREFRVSGDEPVAIDQIPLHTHNIENVGDEDLVTFFWTNRIFDPASPDTYADPV